MKFAAADHERLRQCGGDCLADAHRTFGGANATREHRKFIAAEPRSHRVFEHQRIVKSLFHLSQHFVARTMPERIVHVLKLVQIEQQQRGYGVGRLRLRDLDHLVDIADHALSVE